MTLYPSVLELIGNTPLVDISSLSPNPSARLLIKLEGQNPGGSVKDRVALSLVEQAENDGLLVPGKPDQILMEPSSGNTGIGLALVCKVKGYHIKVVMPTNVSIERRQLLQLWGAEIIESPGWPTGPRWGRTGPGWGRVGPPSRILTRSVNNHLTCTRARFMTTEPG